jgi:hypothetical protein
MVVEYWKLNASATVDVSFQISFLLEHISAYCADQ